MFNNKLNDKPDYEFKSNKPSKISLSIDDYGIEDIIVKFALFLELDSYCRETILEAFEDFVESNKNNT